MKRLNPYLTFSGNCRAAMEFYRDSLGGELNIMTMGESPMAAQMPPEAKDQVMHANLAVDGMTIMASDSFGPEPVVKGNTITLCINADKKSEIEGYFDKLSRGGKVSQPLKQEFFGIYGMFTDKFGVDWMFQANEA